MRPARQTPAWGPQPYFAMEFVHGRSVRDYAETQHLDTRRRS